MTHTTIYEIAERCGVSIATVSRALNPATRSKVAEKTLRKVLEASRRASYTPSLAARHLGAASYRTIGIALPHFKGMFFSDYYRKIIAGASDAMLESGYTFKMILLQEGPGRHWDRYDFRAGEGVDALVVTHWPNFFSDASALSRLGVPCVVINDPVPGVRAHMAYGDNRQGGRLAAEHLLSKGHRRLLVLGGPRWSSDSRDRIEGFAAAARRGGARCEVVGAGFQESEAHAQVSRLLRRGPRFSAIFACNDLMACGAARAVREAGLSCPQDVSIVGFDDDERSAAEKPALTTLRVPLYDLAWTSVKGLLGYLKGGQKGDFLKGSTVLPVRLIERSSVGVRRGTSK